MSDACRRWIELTDRDAIGESLSESEHAFVVAHAASCLACAKEHAVWDELAVLLDSPARGSRTSEEATSLLMLGASRAQAKRRRWLGWAAAAVFLLAMGGVAARIARPGPVVRAPAATEHTAIAYALDANALVIDGRIAPEGSALHVGSRVLARQDGCMFVEPSVRTCLAAGSRMRVAELGAERRRLELVEGRIVATLEPQPVGSSFGIVTRDGSAVAVGTAFSVEVPEHGAVVTRVMHGTVAVRSRSGRTQHVTAHRMAAMEQTPRALPPEEEAREYALVREAPPPDALVGAPQAAEAPLGDEPEQALVADEREQAPAHTNADREPKQTHAQTNVVRESAQAPAQANVADEPAQANAQAGVVREPARAHEETRPSVSAPDGASASNASAGRATDSGAAHQPASESVAATLMQQAREARAQGDPAGAALRYQQLFRDHADTAEAHAARVPFGELLLEANDPRSARDAFARYVQRGGPLDEEARFGYIRALRALNAPGERSALAAFLHLYPHSPLAASLRPRARELGLQ